eukprot:2550-Heterococcus_DN1.PRE.6
MHVYSPHRCYHKQLYRVLGHIDILGDPLSLATSYGSGVVNFLSKTSRGKAGEGTRDLVKGVLGGTAQSATKVTSAIENMVTSLNSGGGRHEDRLLQFLVAKVNVLPAAPTASLVQTTSVATVSSILLEKLHLTETAAEQSGQQRHLVEGLKYGARHMGRTLVKGVTGVITQPVRGAKDHGTVGFVTCIHYGCTATQQQCAPASYVGSLLCCAAAAATTVGSWAGTGSAACTVQQSQLLL